MNYPGSMTQLLEGTMANIIDVINKCSGEAIWWLRIDYQVSGKSSTTTVTAAVRRYWTPCHRCSGALWMRGRRRGGAAPATSTASDNPYGLLEGGMYRGVALAPRGRLRASCYWMLWR